MASDVFNLIDHQSRTINELLAFIKKELDADSERHTQLHTAAAAAREVLQDGQNGVTIDLSKKNLVNLPAEAIELMKDRVERLAVSHNPQISIPTQIVQCERLRYLNIRWNSLTEFPVAVLQLSKLEILDLSRNKLTSIPEDIKKLNSLKFLAVARNRITRLPLALGEMSSLGKLKFDENPLHFPPSDTYKLSPDQYSAHETERDKEICQKVKKFLRAAALKEKLRAFPEDDLSEDHVETPRPPKRSVTAGRFPIRPSVGGIDSMIEAKNESPAQAISPPPVPLRSHARVESSTSPNVKRPGIAPLMTNGADRNRSRSETVSSSVSLRQRRHGFIRKPAGELASVTENVQRTKEANATGPAHLRGASSVSAGNSATHYNEADASGTISPVPGRLGRSRKQNSYSGASNGSAKNHPSYKLANRLIETFTLLNTHVNSIVLALTDGAPHLSSIGQKYFSVQSHLYDLGREMSQIVVGAEGRSLSEQNHTTRIIHQAVLALRSYRTLLAELNRRSTKALRHTEPYKLRPFLMQMHGTTIELRNACVLLDVKVIERGVLQERARVSKAWSSKSVTPTQPKAPMIRRPPRPPMLQGVGNNAMPRAVPVQPMPTRTDRSRANTMTSQSSAGTAPSMDPVSSTIPAISALSRINILRNMVDDSESDADFDRIFLKLQAACNAASQALPQCRKEFQMRKELAQANEQRDLTQQWTVLIDKSDEVVAHNRALKKRLETIRVVDPSSRHQRDFWQYCDSFVLSWAELATNIKELSQQRVDINSIKHLMRNVQRHVKDVSKMIFNSPLYHNARQGHIKPGDTSAISGTVSPNPLAWSTAHEGMRTPGGYVTSPTPATPLSATLGPGLHAALPTPTSAMMPRDYFHEPPTARRYDTPMQYSQATSFSRRH